MTTALLVRHAHCEPVGRRVAGRAAGVPLDAEGRRQAARLGERLRHLPLAAVVSSPLERAAWTAVAIARPHGLTVVCDEAWSEVDVGEWTGMELTALEHDERWRRWNHFRGGTRAPGGELMIEVQARAVAALARLADQHRDAMVAVVSHADVLRAVLAHHLGMSLDHLARLELAPASVSAIEIGEWGARVVM
ncbi:MAG TPA: histidine phosphatase family protein, partial [Gemmatimonadaceae bacterium]|nr:histidine phosphatase family protein [Gemmatimonadaceae bacterium]